VLGRQSLISWARTRGSHCQPNTITDAARSKSRHTLIMHFHNLQHERRVFYSAPSTRLWFTIHNYSSHSQIYVFSFWPRIVIFSHIYTHTLSGCIILITKGEAITLL